MKNICMFVKNLLISSLIVFATLCSAFAITTAIALNLSGNNFTAYAEEVPTISAGDFKTTGASVRVFKITTDADGNKTYQETNRTGIRFHVGMSADYISIADGYLNLFDVNSDARNENGSYVIAEGYKTYTLIIPTRKLGNSDLTATFDGVLQIDTTNYWFNDGEGNLESVAYVYDVPEHRLNDVFAFRGIVCSVDENGNETPVAWTDIGTRSLAYVAKRAYNDTNDNSYDYWGTSDNDAFAAPIIKQFIPTYQLTIKTYNGDGSFTESVSQEVLWGDMPSDYLTVVEGDKWYHENNQEEINFNTPFDLPNGSVITAVSSNHSYFVFTGVEYTETGFNVSATLPTQFFKNGTEIESSAIDMVTNSGNHISATKAVINVTGTGNDATTKLAITFDYTNIKDQTTLTILKSSNFYYNGVLYQLETDYDFIYENKKWQLPLGQITIADIQAENGIVDYHEGTPVENAIRITFNRDILINGSVTFEGDVYVTREDTKEKISITSGHYFWNQGSAKILEIPGELDTTILHNLKGINDGDTLTITAGTKLIQNNGYYVFPNDIVATFNGESVWEFSFVTHEITASEFTAAYTRREGDSIYIDVYTSQRWANKMVKVVLNDGTLTYNNTDNTTSIDPKKIFYHGEDNHQILRIYIEKWSETGDWVTIPSGTKFYVGNQIYHLTESVISYFVETSEDGMSWITNPNIQEISLNNITSMGWYQGNVRYTTDTIWSEAPNNFIIVDDTFIEGDGISISGSPYTGLYYYGATNSILELQGTNFGVGGGAVTLKKGTILWLFNNTDKTSSGAYLLKDDLSVEISGGSNSTIYKNTEVATISKNEIVAIYNDGSHAGETRFELNRDKIPNTYGEASVEGVATLNGEATTSAFVYGGDGTAGYAGNPIIALTGNNFGRPFQATEKGDKIIIEQGTKIWLSNGSGYVTFAEDWIYVYNGNSYSDWSIMRNVNFSGANTTVKIDGLTITNTMINTGEKLTFTVEIPAGYEISTVSNATLVSHNGNVYTYVTDYIFGDLSVAINATEPIVINSNSITSAYFEDNNEIRLALDKANIPALNDITGGNYNITFIGETVLTINGVSATPTQYNYFGLIGETNHQLLGIQLNAPMTLNDQLTIKGGSKFKFGATILYVEEDITITTVVANFDENLATLALDGIGINNGVTALKVVTGKESTLTFGWKDKSYSAIYDLSVKINGVEHGNSGTYTITLDGNVVIDVTTHMRTYAVTWTNPTGATITVTANGNAINSGDTVTAGTSISVTATASSGYRLNTVTIGGSAQNGVSTTQAGSSTFSYTVNATTAISATTVKMYSVSWTATNATYTVTANGSSISSGKYVDTGTSISITVVAAKSNYTIKTVTINGSQIATAAVSNYSHTVTEDTTITNTAERSSVCIVEGTMITLADGTQKAIEDVQIGDMALVFNHFTGTVEARPLIAIAHKDEEAKLCNILNLQFSNGTVFRMVGHHGLFDRTLGEYVMISSDNVNQYVGHKFYIGNIVNGEFVNDDVMLTNYTMTTEVVRIFSPVTEEIGNYFANGLLNVGPLHRNTLTCGHINYFDFDENLKYDEAQVKADIEKYGLYTYDDFKEYVSEEVFNALSFKYYKIAVGKGLMTEDDIYGLIYELKNT